MTLTKKYLFGSRSFPMPVDAPFKSWRAYANDNYTDDQVKTGVGYSAIVGLRKVKDPILLLCEKAKKKERLMFWEDINHLAPKNTVQSS